MSDGEQVRAACHTCRHGACHSQRPEHCAFCRGRRDLPGYEKVEGPLFEPDKEEEA